MFVPSWADVFGTEPLRPGIRSITKELALLGYILETGEWKVEVLTGSKRADKCCPLNEFDAVIRNPDTSNAEKR